MSEAESVRVAVRVRPFNQREKDHGAKLIIDMQGQLTTIKNPETPSEEPKKFSFDFSYWSHDGFTERADGVLEPTAGSKYASQPIVFKDLGQGVLDNAFEGYNCSLFAYGQTGSGKSYSMVGYGNNKGIVPMTCDKLFQAVNNNSDPNKRFEVSFSMLEIYNEQVRDLLSKDKPKGGLPVRQNPKMGFFYVQGLKRAPVGSYEDIEAQIDKGTANRTVASTNMNATSSRAHTVVTITFDQIIKDPTGQEKKKSSEMNLVDLAGSERAESTGATGDRLKEGANINKSLSALGNVISALADLSMGKKKVMVPYRDSVLTKLLQNALGGNSKTIMIAALSPADINYDETLSTLRYADRAKKIKNKAVINENPMDKLIRELKEENERLKKQMEGGGGPIAGGVGMTAEEIEKYKEEIRLEMEENMKKMGGMSWDEQVKQSRQEAETDSGGKATSNKKSTVSHFVNLNEDPMLSSKVYYFLEKPEVTIGRKDAEPMPDICLSGLSIMKQHAVVTNSGGDYEIKPGAKGAKIKVNGMPLTGPRPLAHKDRVLFGSNHMYVFYNAQKPNAPEGTPPDSKLDWEFAQKEIAQAKGFATGSGAGLSKEQQIAQEQVLEILPMVTEVNAISEELDKHRSFEVVLISSAAQEGGVAGNKGTSGEAGIRVMVKMKNLLNGNTWLWERGKFMNRRYLAQELYQRFLDGEDAAVKNLPKEEDPFWEPTEDVLIGTANVFLQSLGYALDFEDTLTVTDYKGQEEGTIMVVVAPCNAKGNDLDDDSFVDSPEDLLGKPYHYKVTVQKAEVHKARFSKGVRIKYKVPTVQGETEEYTETPMVRGSLSPVFNHSKVFSIPVITQEHLDNFETKCITLMMYGLQEDSTPDPKLMKMTTKELRQMENMTSPQSEMHRRNTTFGLDPERDQSALLKSEYQLVLRKYERLEQKERRLQQMCEEWGNKKPEEQDFLAFHRAVHALAHSTGTKLKTRVQMLNKSKSNIKQADDTISLFVFGEEEKDFVAEARENDGFVDYENLTKHHGENGLAQISENKAKINEVLHGIKALEEQSQQSQANHSDLLQAQRAVQNGNKGAVKSGKTGEEVGKSRACVIQ
ncbi:kinesin-like protein KIF28P isoform X2 [Lingula anatina]|uniref:Kinesin-like protein 6 n=1 Tax=Lingula anatina TaxID=7574 RepID=A0A2R2MJP5_LINAN|nr:kinesin-like protein KIF28P isoform X2 [Lingula anatina]|eukprot:XP_023930292.1 kinesin-like protein KIF28P isoform X2 [Lingula anatina]